ncbi:hypothetical protein G7Z17_g1809 [Cylindrodendrum hubeiense]|uniref:DUF7735 domain-containing protein n=1 Tax=Cylindrodendrum hubeiense TaxID=595255 RepID=A0A9P5HIQ0_9HYPO|nr:hypothetical protein G7Z17_g1809 [Cylindrodendrum hubeiense]
MRPPTAVLVLQATAAIASIFDTILPTTKGTITSDSWQCATQTFESYFDVPKPTGKLLDPILDYGDTLLKGCKSTLTDAMGMSACTFPPQSDWCGFTKSAPSSLLPAYSSYGSVASSWWAEHSSSAVEDSKYCPNSWFKAMNSLPYGATWLNVTIAFAGCYVAAHPTGNAKTTLAATTTAALKATGSVSKATSTVNNANGVGRRDGAEMWVVAGTGLAAAAVNSIL